MVIDDELDICITLKIVLEQNGFIVNYYNKPVVALDEFKSNFYDLIILDLQMPCINGLQLYREIRKKDKQVKICFLTASETIIDIGQNSSEAYTFITKPVENKELITIVNDVLES